MSNTVLRLEPQSAALSVLRRLETIDQCLAYIRETVKRYDGLKAFEAELERHGIAGRIGYLTAQAPAAQTDAVAEGSD